MIHLFIRYFFFFQKQKLLETMETIEFIYSMIIIIDYSINNVRLNLAPLYFQPILSSLIFLYRRLRHSLFHERLCSRNQSIHLECSQFCDGKKVRVSKRKSKFIREKFGKILDRQNWKRDACQIENVRCVHSKRMSYSWQPSQVILYYERIRASFTILFSSLLLVSSYTHAAVCFFPIYKENQEKPKSRQMESGCIDNIVTINGCFMKYETRQKHSCLCNHSMKFIL